MSLYPDNMHSKRRAADSGIRLLEPQMSEGEWNLYIEELAKYQWTKGVASADEIGKALWKNTQGNVGLASRLYEISMAIAIESDMKALTARFISKVAVERFALVRPLVDAIVNGASDDIEKYSNTVQIIDEQVTTAVQAAVGRAKLRELAELRIVHEAIKGATASLLSLGMPQDDVVKRLKSFVKCKPDADSAWLVAKYLTARAQNDVEGSESDIEKRIAGDMRREHLQRSGRGRRQ